MDTPELIGKHEKVIAAAAWRFRNAAEYDDLYQEGMIAVWRCPPDADENYINSAIFNRMKDWVRYIKRLRHHQAADYEEIVDGIQNGDGGESIEELL